MVLGLINILQDIFKLSLQSLYKFVLKFYPKLEYVHVFLKCISSPDVMHAMSNHINQIVQLINCV